MPLPLNASTTATLTVLDQNGTPITNFDFGANPPTWSDGPNVSLSPGPNPNDEVFTAVAAGQVDWSVTCAGLTATGSFQVEAPAQVPTSLSVEFNPAV